MSSRARSCSRSRRKNDSLSAIGCSSELLLLYEQVNICGKITGNIESLHRIRSSAADRVNVKFMCEAKVTEFVRSMAYMQRKFEDPIVAELKLLRPSNSASSASNLTLSVFKGTVDLAQQVFDQPLTNTQLSIQLNLEQCIENECNAAAASHLFEKFAQAMQPPQLT